MATHVHDATALRSLYRYVHALSSETRSKGLTRLYLHIAHLVARELTTRGLSTTSSQHPPTSRGFVR